MLRTIALICFCCALLGCGGPSEVTPPADAPVIPPSSRTDDNPGLPPLPGQAPGPSR